jgi:hypothetical protein
MEALLAEAMDWKKIQGLLGEAEDASGLTEKIYLLSNK